MSPRAGRGRHRADTAPRRGGSSEERWLRRLLPALLNQRRDVASAAVAATVVGLASTGTPFVERRIIDHVLRDGAARLPPLLAAQIVLALLLAVGSAVRRRAANKAVLHAQDHLRAEAHERLQQSGPVTGETLGAGELLTRTNSDLGILTRIFGTLPTLLSGAVLLVGSLAVMVSLSLQLAVLTALVVPCTAVIGYRMRIRMVPAVGRGQRQAGTLAQVVNDALIGAEVVKAFGQERREIRRLTAAAEELFHGRLAIARLQVVYQPLMRAVPALGQAGVLAVGSWLAWSGRVTVGTFLAFSSYLVLLMGPANSLAVLLADFPRGRAAAGRVLELIDTAPAVVERPGAPELRPLRGQVDFEGVGFAYRPNRPILTDFTLRIAAGETVALVGPSGAGASTVAMLLARFHDVDAGAVRVDGVDVRDVSLTSLRSQIGMAFEDVFLFTGTVRDNIAFGHPHATDEEVRTAARIAHADDFVQALPNGYDTLLGDGGTALSGGQRQRLALARALVADPRLVILDDATHAVDAEREEEIHASLRQALRQRTALVVAHRRSTLLLADRIAVLDGGRVVDAGTHAELLERCPEFVRLLRGTGAILGEDVEASTPQPDEGRPAAQQEAATETADETLARLPPGPFSFARFLRPYRLRLAVCLALVAADAVTVMGGPLLAREGIDLGVINGRHDVVLVAVCLAVAVALLGLVSSAFSTLLAAQVAERVTKSLRIALWRHIQTLSMDFHEREPAAGTATRMSTDVSAFATLVQDGLCRTLASALMIVAIGAAMAVLSPPLAGVVALVMLPLAGATGWFWRRQARPYEEARQRITQVNSHLYESLVGRRESQLFGQQRRRQAEFRTISRRYVAARLDAQRPSRLYFPLVEFFSQFSAVVVLAVSAWMLADHAVTPGVVVAFVLYLGLLFWPIQQLSDAADIWQQARVASRRIGALAEERSGTPTSAEPVVPARLVGEVRLEDVRFSYPAVRARGAALRGVDLVIRPGETVALVGSTGAGKSSVLKMIARFYDPNAGRVLVDGLDLRDLDPEAYHARLGHVPQEPFLFGATVRDNIAYGRPGATDEEVETVAREVGAHGFITALPGGYHHRLGERAISLSAGQRQLICLARALLVDPAVLLLDEALSRVDQAGQARVMTALRRVATGRTTILVTHHLPVARDADRVVLLDGGRVRESGPHDELLALGGAYKALWRAHTSGKEIQAVARDEPA